MTGLLIALTLAATHTLCVLAGGLYIHHRHTARLAKLAAWERATRRDVEIRDANPQHWLNRQVDRNRQHTLGLAR